MPKETRIQKILVYFRARTLWMAPKQKLAQRKLLRLVGSCVDSVNIAYSAKQKRNTFGLIEYVHRFGHFVINNRNRMYIFYVDII